MNNNGWNSFFGSREGQMAMYGIATLFSAYYAIDAVRELIHPDLSSQLAVAIGDTAYIALLVARFVVLTITSIAFGRLIWKLWQQRDNSEK